MGVAPFVWVMRPGIRRLRRPTTTAATRRVNRPRMAWRERSGPRERGGAERVGRAVRLARGGAVVRQRAPTADDFPGHAPPRREHGLLVAVVVGATVRAAEDRRGRGGVATSGP